MSSSSSSSSPSVFLGAVSTGLVSFSSKRPDSISVFNAGVVVELDSAIAAGDNADELRSNCAVKIRWTTGNRQVEENAGEL